MRNHVVGTQVPGCYTDTRLLAGYPGVIRVPGYPPKIAANSREYPPPKISGYLIKTDTR